MGAIPRFRRRCRGLGAAITLWLLALTAGTAHAQTGAPADWPAPIKDSKPYAMVLVDRLEAGFGDGQDTNVWDAQLWWGGDYHKLWLKTEGEGEQGESLEAAELQVLYSRLISPFWQWQVGARHDFRPAPARDFFVFGIQGVAPYRFEVDAAGFLSDDGDLSFRLETEYEVLFTQRLILQPRFELNAAAQDVPALGVGAGVGSTELGARLRYEIRRELAPYVGVTWQERYGETADLARAEGEPTSTTAVVVGLRMWW